MKGLIEVVFMTQKPRNDLNWITRNSANDYFLCERCGKKSDDTPAMTAQPACGTG